jgi:pyruvate dehydrogenase E2 component (dihydrolipoamide acetyltransferase)
MTEVIMPKMGDGMEEGTLVEWLKKDGDSVKSGEVIGSIQTDKATLELEAPGTGVLTGILLEAGGTVPVGKPIAAILKPGETLPAGWGGATAPAATASAPAEVEPVVEAAPAATESPIAEVAAVSDRVKASPLARRIAEENSVDLRAIAGTGPNGRIVQQDVLNAIGQTAALAPAAAPVAAATTRIVANAEDQVIKLPRLRQITAKRTTESKQQVPHFYVTVEVDVERIMALREMFESEESGKVSVNDFVIKASALALRDMPDVNAVFQGDQVTIFGGVHVGMAVALADGLTVPVIHNADQLSLRAISAKARELAKKARDNKLSLNELTGSTFSISNMGMLDVDNFLAIINQPNSAIVAIASARKKVVVNDQDEIEVRQRMNITGSFDHRALDGAVGAKFINLIKNYLENPTRLLS